MAEILVMVLLADEPIFFMTFLPQLANTMNDVINAVISIYTSAPKVSSSRMQDNLYKIISDSKE